VIGVACEKTGTEFGGPGFHWLWLLYLWRLSDI